jgi:hypothetical protein
MSDGARLPEQQTRSSAPPAGQRPCPAPAVGRADLAGPAQAGALTAPNLFALQRLAGNRATGALIGSTEPSCGLPPSQQLGVQRDLLGDAWDTVNAAGPAVVNAAQLVARVASNLPFCRW